MTSNCASCHNGVLATGKGAAHIASNERVPELPHDDRLAACALRSPGRHGELRELP